MQTDNIPLGRTLTTVQGNPTHDPSIDDGTNPPFPAADRLAATFPLTPRYMYRVQYHGSRTRMNENGFEADIHAWHPQSTETQSDLRDIANFRETVRKALSNVQEQGFYSPFVALYADEASADFWARDWRRKYTREWERCWLYTIDTERLPRNTTRFYSVWDLRNTIEIDPGDILHNLIWQHKSEALVLHRIPNEAIVAVREVMRPTEFPWYKRYHPWKKTKQLFKTAFQKMYESGIPLDG